MANLKFADTHNMVTFLSKPEESDGFEQIVDFLNAHPINLHAIDARKINVTESTVRRDLQLEDAEGVDCEGSANPTDPHHTPTIIHSSTQPQDRQKPGKLKDRHSDTLDLRSLVDNVADEAVHKELGDSLVRVVVPGAKKPWGILLLKLDEEITLVSVQDDVDKEVFDVDALNGEEVFVAGQNENVVEEVVDVAQVSTAATTITINTKEITLAQALEALKTSKPNVKGIKKDQILLDEETTLKLQAEFDKEERLEREKAEKVEEANIVTPPKWVAAEYGLESVTS
ncbi:hypothetical protein Tco_0026164 [Tanacetum coccineum]